jgi:sulfite reductase beta subunit-like hemoprotein
MVEDAGKTESKIEVVKRNSRHLRGTIAETLASEATHFSESDETLLKFHGAYQQDDRDVRHERRKQKLEEAYMFMIRCAIPGGVVTADQYLAMDELADRCANGTLRVTTRQGFQFHGVIKKNLKAAIAGINHCLLTTLSACGDVERNVMTCPAPLADEAHVLLRRLAREIAVQLRPGTRAYHEIWLDGEKAVSTEQEEPFYGDTYLPRKFKSGIAIADDNCIDVYNYDAGLIAIVEGGKVAGFNVLVGGGMGMTHGKADTVARLAEPVGFVDPEHGVETIRTIAAIFRDFGNRADRRHARLKYVINERGIEWFRDEFRHRAPFDLLEWRPIPRPSFHDHLGRHPQGDGKWFYGVFIENGRIADRDDVRMKTALREIVRRFRPGLALTASQNIMLTGLTERDIDAIEGLLTDHGVKTVAQLTAARRYSMACPALPTCGLAMAESERVMPGVVDMFENELTSLGLRDAPITLRMTGCPNGCARPYTADIAFVGRRPDIYHDYVGGGMEGDRVADLYAADVTVQDLVATLRPLLAAWAKDRRPNEGLSDFYQRILQRDAPRQSITGREDPTRELVELKIGAQPEETVP